MTQMAITIPPAKHRRMNATGRQIRPVSANTSGSLRGLLPDNASMAIVIRIAVRIGLIPNSATEVTN
jgi:hypothetical protein